MQNSKENNSPLWMRTTGRFGFSKSPWTETDIPVGSIVRFVSTCKPALVAHAQCRYHGNGSSKCRHLVINYDGLEIPTSVCMEDAAVYYFVLA